jgi:hypothetical protein
MDRGLVCFSLVEPDSPTASLPLKSEELDRLIPGVVDEELLSKRSRGELGFEFSGLAFLECVGELGRELAGE